jgi:type VI protein secretion system component VasK
VVVEGGHHRVDMKFEPRGWEAGVRLTRIGMLALLALAVVWSVWTWRERGNQSLAAATRS